MPQKLVLIVIDGLTPAALERAVESEDVPALRFLMSHGEYRRAVTTFPSLTPVCLSSIATGAHPDVHEIPHLVWYHRGEQRLVEYGSSFAAIRAAGATRTIRDVVFNLNEEHLSKEAVTVYEALEAAGRVTAAVNMPVFLIFGFWLVTSAFARGAFLALAGWTKFGALLLAPLWAGYPESRRLSGKAAFAGGFAAATAAAFSILLLEPSPAHAARVFWDRTFGWQVGRDSPFSIWGWGQYHAAGIPDLGPFQQIAIALLVLGAIACYFVPRRKTPLQLAALTAAVLIGFELTLTHWFYLYIPWFFPFVAFVVLAARRRPVETVPAHDDAERELVPAG